MPERRWNRRLRVLELSSLDHQPCVLANQGIDLSRRLVTIVRDGLGEVPL